MPRSRSAALRLMMCEAALHAAAAAAAPPASRATCCFRRTTGTAQPPAALPLHASVCDRLPLHESSQTGTPPDRYGSCLFAFPLHYHCHCPIGNDHHSPSGALGFAAFALEFDGYHPSQMAAKHAAAVLIRGFTPDEKAAAYAAVRWRDDGAGLRAYVCGRIDARQPRWRPTMRARDGQIYLACR